MKWTGIVIKKDGTHGPRILIRALNLAINMKRDLLNIFRGTKDGTLTTTGWKPKVTMGWDLYPTIALKDGGVLPRNAEMIINKKYYPTGTLGEWPCDPVTGEKLEIDY